MSQFSYNSVILHNRTAYEVNISGNSSENSVDPEVQANGLHGAVKVSIRNLQAKEAQFSAVTTYIELSSLLEDAKTYVVFMTHGGNSFYPRTPRTTSLLDAHKTIFENILPTTTALHHIANGKNEHGQLVWLDGAGEEAIEDAIKEGQTTPVSPSYQE